MNRPLASEIAPGDVDAVRRVAFALDGIGDDADTIMGRLRTLDGGSGPQFWRGDAGDGFRRMLTEIGPEVGKLTLAHRDAADALRSYATALTEAQEQARRAESDWSIADTEQDRARNQRARARSEAASEERSARLYRERVVEAGTARVTAMADPVYLAELDRYETTMRDGQQRAESRATQARGDEAEARQAEAAAAGNARAAEILAAQAREIRGDAAQRAVALIDDAADLAPSRPSTFQQIVGRGGFLDRVTGSPEFGKWMQRISDAGGIMLNVGSIMAMVPIPGVQQIGLGLMIGGVALKGIALAGTLLAWQYGHAKGKDAAYRGADLLLSGLTARSGLGSAGLVKRAVNYRGAGVSTTGFSGGIKAAGQLAGRERKLLTAVNKHAPDALRVRPSTYFRAAVGTQVVTTVGNATIEGVDSARNLVAGTRPGFENHGPSAAGHAINETGDLVKVPIGAGAAGGVVELGLRAKEKIAP